MGDHENRLALARQLPQQFADLLHVVAVESAGGLVKDDEVLAAHQCRADGNPLLLPAGQAHRMPFDERCKVKIGHDLIGLSGDAGIRLVESDEQFLAHAVGEQLVVDILHDQESGAGQVARFRGHAVELDAARNRLDESGQRAHERGLAAAVGAEYTHALPGRDFKGQPVQHRMADLEGFFQVFNSFN